MAGYHGYSMSNNAVKAYERGERPLSKWKKSDIIDEIEVRGEYTCDIELLKKLNLKELRGLCLTYSSWHHTSNHFNETDFYEVKDMSDVTNDQIINIINSRTKEKPVQEPERRGRITVNVWGGTRNHPRIIGTDTQEGVVRGNWLHYPGGRYNIYSNKKIHFEYID